MSKRNKFKKGGKGPSFIMLRHDMNDSPAWRSLSPIARCVWLEIMRRHNGINNGDISLSCREAAELCNVSKNTAAKAFNDLRDRGFIKVAVDSSFNYKKKTARRWTVTHEGIGIAKSTNEWRKWKPES